MKDQLFIIDSTGPFFVKHPKTQINWSKAPHGHLERDGRLPKKTGKKIRANFKTYISRAADIGYNAVSIDELSRIALPAFYPADLQRKIRRYRKYYRRLFALSRQHGMGVFITSDLMFFHECIDERTGGDFAKIIELLSEMLDELFTDFPEVVGVIFRAGESDGVDVQGDFLSRIILKTPGQANELIRKLLPVFERHDKTLIFRTWTVGAYDIGDLMWNPATYEAVFQDIESEHLVISMKYGEGDFFRYLDLNPLFLRDSRKKIIELQARREYEGFGEFPCFVGFQYEALRDALSRARGMVGIHVWCQTGGWSRFRNFTFLKNTSFWNELNTHVTLKLFKYSLQLPRALASFSSEETGWKQPNAPAQLLFIEFLRLSDEVIQDALYDPAFAGARLYVNRTRVPPLLHVFWDNVTVTDHIRTLYKTFATDQASAIKRARFTLPKIARMRRIARRLGLPYDHDFHYSTFRLLILCREALYTDRPERTKTRLQKRLELYRERYPNTYTFKVEIQGKDSYLLQLLLKVMIREHRSYRRRDRLLFNAWTARLYTAIFQAMRKKFPGFVNNQGMPIEKILS